MRSLESDEEEPKHFEQEAEFQPVPLEVPLSQVAEPSLIGIESVTIDTEMSQRSTEINQRPAKKKLVGILKKPQNVKTKPSTFFKQDEKAGENVCVKAASENNDNFCLPPPKTAFSAELKSANEKDSNQEEKKGIKWLRHVLEPDAFQLLQQHENEMNELKNQLKILLERQHKVEESSFPLIQKTAASFIETREQSTQTEPIKTYEQGLIKNNLLVLRVFK